MVGRGVAGRGQRHRQRRGAARGRRLGRHGRRCRVRCGSKRHRRQEDRCTPHGARNIDELAGDGDREREGVEGRVQQHPRVEAAGAEAHERDREPEEEQRREALDEPVVGREGDRRADARRPPPRTVQSSRKPTPRKVNSSTIGAAITTTAALSANCTALAESQCAGSSPCSRAPWSSVSSSDSAISSATSTPSVKPSARGQEAGAAQPELGRRQPARDQQHDPERHRVEDEPAERGVVAVERVGGGLPEEKRLA